jgi:hypothetical protein
MCKEIKIISKIKDGEILKCNTCNSFTLTYRNLFFEFSPPEFDNFKKYISKIDVNYWEDNSCIKTKRKVFIPTQQENLILMFHKKEIKDLKILLNINDSEKFVILNSNQIDFDIVYN